MFNKKGQVAIEVLVIIGIVILGAVIFGAFFINKNVNSIQESSQLTGTADDLRNQLDYTGESAPSSIVCGNNICEPGETYLTCSDCPCEGPDCGGPQDPCVGINTEADCNADTCEICLQCSGLPVCSTTCPGLDYVSFYPEGGVYSSSIPVRITSFNGYSCDELLYELHYTLDNTEPTESSLVYSLSIVITEDTNITVKHFIKNLRNEYVDSGESKKAEYIISNNDLCLQGVGGGNGTVYNPKVICTPQELNDIRNHNSWYYNLGQDIDLNHTILSNDPTATWYDDVNGWLPISVQDENFEHFYLTGQSTAGIGSFHFFNGNNYKIKNLYINRPTTDDVGLFGKITTPKELILINLNLENINVIGNNNVGGIAGRFSTLGSHKNIGISNCSVTGNITGNNFVGGMIGSHRYLNISNCDFSGNVSGYSYVGGITGGLSTAQINNSYSQGNVSGLVVNSGGNIGGLVGTGGGYYSKIINSHSASLVSGNQSIGGLVGSGGNIITNCYATGAVSGNTNVGGIVGFSYGNIDNSYATGNVLANNYAGGFIGYRMYDLGHSISNNYSLGNVTRKSGSTSYQFGGFVGYLDTYITPIVISKNYSIGKVIFEGTTDPTTQGFSADSFIGTANFWDINASGQLTNLGNGATGKTTTQMKTQSTFVDWNFTDIWAINPSINNGYPYLRSNPPN